MTRNFTLAAICFVALATGRTATAQSVTYNNSVPLTATDWNTNLSIPKFNPALGNLTSITFTLSGDIMSRFRAENLDSAPSKVDMTAAGQITLTRPDNSTLVLILPTLSQSQVLPAFDGNFDFGGTSSIDITLPKASGSDFFTSTLLSDFALFTGSGNILLPVDAKATSSISGSGNLASIINTQADADVSVTYNYEVNQNAPEGSSLAMIGLGALPMGMFAIRRYRSRAVRK